MAKEIERKPERIPNRHEYMPKKETNDSKNKELPIKVVCYGCGQTGHMAKDKECLENTMMVMKKSSRMLERQTQTKAETKTFIIMVKINGQEVIVLLDSGCTMEAISPERTDTHTIGYQRE